MSPASPHVHSAPSRTDLLALVAALWAVLLERRAELSARLDTIERELPALEGEWKAAVAAEVLARDVESLAKEAELELANVEAQFDRIHGELIARASLVRELDAAAAPPLPGSAARRAIVLETLAELRASTPDALLDDRHALALTALAPAHRRSRSAAVALDTTAPELRRGETLRALGAITACKRRSRELEARVVALNCKWPLPLVPEDTTGWADDGRLPALMQSLRVVSSELQVILLTAHPLRFDPTQIDCAEDLDPPGDARRRAPDLGRIPR